MRILLKLQFKLAMFALVLVIPVAIGIYKVESLSMPDTALATASAVTAILFVGLLVVNNILVLVGHGIAWAARWVVYVWRNR